MHVTAALDLLESVDDEIEEIEAGRLTDLRAKRAALKDAIDKFVMKSKQYEDAGYKLTRVQSYRRKWDTAKLERILPRPIFKRIVKVEADPAKIDEFVKGGAIKLKEIEAALIEEPNAPYIKWTKITAKPDAQAEAEALAAKLS